MHGDSDEGRKSPPKAKRLKSTASSSASLRPQLEAAAACQSRDALRSDEVEEVRRHLDRYEVSAARRCGRALKRCAGNRQLLFLKLRELPTLVHSMNLLAGEKKGFKLSRESNKNCLLS